MDRRDQAAEHRDRRRLGVIGLVVGHERADRPHPVDPGIRLVGRDDEGDGQDAGEAHPEEEPAPPIEQPEDAAARLLIGLRLQIAGQMTTHVRNDGRWSSGPERTGGWIRSPVGGSARGATFS